MNESKFSKFIFDLIEPVILRVFSILKKGYDKNPELLRSEMVLISCLLLALKVASFIIYRKEIFDVVYTPSKALTLYGLGMAFALIIQFFATKALSYNKKGITSKEISIRKLRVRTSVVYAGVFTSFMVFTVMVMGIIFLFFPSIIMLTSDLFILCFGIGYFMLFVSCCTFTFMAFIDYYGDKLYSEV